MTLGVPGPARHLRRRPRAAGPGLRREQRVRGRCCSGRCSTTPDVAVVGRRSRRPTSSRPGRHRRPGDGRGRRGAARGRRRARGLDVGARCTRSTFREETLGVERDRPARVYFDEGPYPGRRRRWRATANSWNVPAPIPTRTIPTTCRSASTRCSTVTNLPSYRLAIDMSDVDGARIIITTGQSGNPVRPALRRPDRGVADRRDGAAAVQPGRHRGGRRLDPDPHPVIPA